MLRKSQFSFIIKAFSDFFFFALSFMIKRDETEFGASPWLHGEMLDKQENDESSLGLYTKARNNPSHTFNFFKFY